MAEAAEEMQKLELRNHNEKAKPKFKEMNSPSKQIKRNAPTSPQPEISKEEEQKLAEEQAEEKKKFEVMRKYYRNRHHTFLNALVEQKKKAEEDQKLV